jgi:hypothetical protein|tara:strand:+ start:2447 stop:2629 length:183 start_codon:yes stop_codon:yes gene_type:complete
MVKNTFEIMEYHRLNYRSNDLKIKFIKYLILYYIVYSTPLSNIIIEFQKIRGNKIGKGFV